MKTSWIAYLRGETVDEDSNRYEKFSKREADIYPWVERLAEMCDSQELPNAPPSLTAACADYPRSREWSRST
ncbi:MAG: hypothetical protein AB1486_03415 [Planctomycetota bacterium]